MIDPSPWSGLELVRPLTGGNRNDVWLGRYQGAPVAVRRSRRSAASLDWELDLVDQLAGLGFTVPDVLAADDGRRSADGVVVQRWLDGRPPASEPDWQTVADELRRLHEVTGEHPQRPGCVTVRELATARRSVDADLDAMPTAIADMVVAVFDGFDDVPAAVIHGDPGPENIRIGPDGSVGLLDWDESRVDLAWHDLSNLAVQVLDDHSHRRAKRLSNAWEAVNGWLVEPDYARHRLSLLDER